jgi:hypothetical protein
MKEVTINMQIPLTVEVHQLQPHLWIAKWKYFTSRGKTSEEAINGLQSLLKPYFDADEQWTIYDYSYDYDEQKDA